MLHLPLLHALLLLPGCSEYGLETFSSHPRPSARQQPQTVETEEVYGDTAAPGDTPPDDDTPDTGYPDGYDSDAGNGDSGTPDTGTPDTGTPDTGTPDTGTPDTGTTVTEVGAEVCEDSIGDDCNGDLGYGDQCDPEDNTNGCSDEKFWAWCNRRNPAYPDIWYDFLRDWVDDRCDGVVALTDEDGDGYQTYTCLDSSGVVYSCTTPLVLQFSSTEVIRFTPVTHQFPLDPDAGTPTRHDWPTTQTPWLAYDRDGNRRIDDGSELFGSATRLPSGERARHGFLALASFDSDQDGQVTAADAQFSGLLLWADLDGDGYSDPGELRGLGDSGVLALSLAYHDAPRCDGLGNCERERSGFTYRGAAGRVEAGSLVDVYVRSHPATGPLVSMR